MDITAIALAESLGDRLKQARLNQNLTQAEVANTAGITRKALINAEKGKAQLEVFLAAMIALNLTNKIDLFLAPQEISPLQLAKLEGNQRKRASGPRSNSSEENTEW